MGAFSASKLVLKARGALGSHASSCSSCSRGKNAAKSNLKSAFLGMLGLERGGADERGPNAQSESAAGWLAPPGQGPTATTRPAPSWDHRVTQAGRNLRRTPNHLLLGEWTLWPAVCFGSVIMVPEILLWRGWQQWVAEGEIHPGLLPLEINRDTSRPPKYLVAPMFLAFSKPDFCKCCFFSPLHTSPDTH